MRPLSRFPRLAVTLLAITAVAGQSQSAMAQSPVMEYASLLDSFDVGPSGRLQLEGRGSALTTIFLPRGAEVEAVITKKGSNTPLHVQDFYINHVTEVFARLQTAGKYKEFVFQESGDYVLTYRTGDQVMTQLPFSVYKRTNNDAFDPRTAWYASGPWSEWAHAYARLKDGADATLQFRMWAKRESFDGASVTDKYTVQLKKDGDIIAQSGTGYIGTQEWLQLKLDMSEPESKGGRKFSVKQLGARDGKYHFVVYKNQQLHSVYELTISNSMPVLHARQGSNYAPRTEYMAPRYAGLEARGTEGNIVWMRRLPDAAAKAIAEGQAAEVAGPTDEMKQRWHWLPTGIDPNRPFKFTVSDIETRTDTGLAVGEDLVVFGTGFPTGVKYMKAGDTQPREIPAGETFSSKVFCVTGKKIILTKRTSVFVFDTETETMTSIPENEISLYDPSTSLIRSDGYLVATVNAATRVTDGNIIKVIDVSGASPKIIPIRNANYTDRDVSSVSVDAKRGHLAVASAQKKLVTAAKIAPLADQYLYDVSEYRGVARFDITIEDEVVYYVDEDYKVRALDLTDKSPKAVTQVPIARSGNGFWVRKGRLAVVTKEGKFGSRYPIAISESLEAPQVVSGTGTKIEGTSAALGMGGSVAIAIDKTVFLAGTSGDSIGVGERLQVLTETGWQPILGEDGLPVWGSEVVTSTGFMAMKVRNEEGRTVIGYATYGQRISDLGAGVASQAEQRMDPSTPVADLVLANDNPYNTDDEKTSGLLEAFLENEKQVGEAYLQAFGKEEGAKKTVEGIVGAMRSAGHEDLVDDYLRHSIFVSDAERPQTSGQDSAGQVNDPRAVMAALNGQWKAIRFSAQGNDLPDAAIENLRLTFASGKYVMNMGPELQTGTYDIETSRAPMAMTIHIGSGDKQGQNRQGSFKLLEGDRLLIVFATNETDHPTRFVPDSSGDSILAVYQKMK